MDTKALPIRQHAEDIVASVRAHPVTVVIGETGSGKTTQISQLLLEAGLAEGGAIAVTQPRRVAAVMVARRVASERGCEVGGEVGYAVRFEDRSSRATRIKYLTDGTLLRECLEDPSLKRYSVIILDEAHERTLNTDILFGLLKALAGSRDPPLRLVVTSATLDGEKFAKYFNNCPVFHVPGRCFPVEVVYSMDNHATDYAAAAVDAAVDIHCTQPEGDILVFLTGQAEIDKACRALSDAVRALPAGECGDLAVLPLYAALPPEMQARVFAAAPPGARRCVVATNIAETSVTVDGVVYLIDSGVVKQKDYNPATGMDSLAVVPISRVQATQRAGRAGRTRPGRCYRLYTRKFFERDMPEATAPEIQRTGLAGAALYLKSLPALDLDVLGFDYLDPPARGALEDALRTLYLLDAIDVDGRITPIGRRMAALPLDPCLCRALLAAEGLGCLDEMMTVAGMLSPEGSVFLGGKGPEQLAAREGGGDGQGRQRGGPGSGGPGGLRPEGRAILERLLAEGLGDHVLLLRLYQEWERCGGSIDWCRLVGVDGRSMRFARDIRQQLARLLGGKAGDGGRDRGIDTGPQGGGQRGGAEGDGGRGEGDRKRGREARRPSEGGGGGREAKRPRGLSDVDALRMALTIGFAPRLARRLPSHNGYRTLGGTDSALAQVHPSCGGLLPDEEGLLPEWVVYQELVATGGKAFLSKVCPVAEEWVSAILPKFSNVDVARLSGGKTAERAKQAAEAAEAAAAAGQAPGGGRPAPAALERKNAAAAVEAARARYLARKAQRGK